MFKKYLLITLISAFIPALCFAAAEDKEAENNKAVELNENSQYQKIIDDYKSYISSINPPLREEIINYRKEIAAINKKKRELYQKLSTNAQDYLSKEQEFRKKLPNKEKGKINLKTPGEKFKTDNSKN